MVIEDSATGNTAIIRMKTKLHRRMYFAELFSDILDDYSIRRWNIILVNFLNIILMTIFDKANFSRGIASKVTDWILMKAFNDLGVKEVELEVFPFNERGIQLYKKLGFQVTEIFNDEDSEEPYKEVMVMKLNKEDYKVK